MNLLVARRPLTVPTGQVTGTVRGRLATVFAITALALITGCYVEERMFWSPDGTRAVVRLPEGLCLVDANGTISAPLTSDVTFAAWLPDSRGLVVLRRLAVTNWSEITRLVPRQETAPVETLARGLPELLKAALVAADGNVEAVEEKFFKPLRLEGTPALLAGLVCLRDTRPAVFKELLRGVKDAGQFEKDLAANSLPVNEISVLRLDGDKLSGKPLVLERTLADLGEPQPSPSAPVVAFLRDDVLTVAPLDGGTNRIEVADKVAGRHDWTPDGKSLAFAVRLAEKRESGTINLAHIQRRSAISATGALTAGDNQLLGTGAFAFTPRVRCLPDGRVLFASLPLQLPKPASSTSEARFYLIDPAKGPDAVPAAIGSEPGALPADLAAFSVSPNGRQIAIVESGSDAVAVLDIASGRLEVVSPKRGAQCRTLPVWRNNDELFYAALPSTGAKRPGWMRWRKGAAPQFFSGRWPAGAVQGLVEMPRQ